jgi:hypothetical protein
LSANCFLICSQYLIKITNYLVEQSQTLETLLVDVIFVIELFVIGDGGEHDRDTTVSLVVELLLQFKFKDKERKQLNFVFLPFDLESLIKSGLPRELEGCSPEEFCLFLSLFQHLLALPEI